MGDISRLAAVLVLAVVTLVACESPRGDDVPYRAPLRDHDIGSGELLYRRDCAWCHGARAEGTRNGPPIVTEGPASFQFFLTTGRMPLEDPGKTSERGEPFYSAEQIEAIVDYSSELSIGPAVPNVDPESGVFELGAELYLDSCSACHSSTGTGSILSSGIPVPDLFESTETEVAEAMLIGPGNMPTFDSFGKEEVDSIAKYVEALQETSNRGGHPLGKLGPFSEGAVAWIVGLGLLLGVIRWIGTRASS